MPRPSLPLAGKTGNTEWMEESDLEQLVAVVQLKTRLLEPPFLRQNTLFRTAAALVFCSAMPQLHAVM